MSDCDVLIVGGGAAGLFCALTAGRRGRRVRVIEHSNRVGKKILMSGGGRCNFTHLQASPAHYISQNPHFCKSALARFKPTDFLAMVERHGIAWHEKTPGQLFCNDSSKQIVQMLEDECRQAGVQIQTGCEPADLRTAEGEFVLQTSQGEQRARRLVVATGGLSIPKMGASGYGIELARSLGHAIVPTVAGLVPLTFSGSTLDHWSPLAGLSTPVELSCGGRSFAGPLLFTHRGISGPPVLQMSSYWQPGQALQIDFLPDRDAQAWLVGLQQGRPDAELRTLLAEALPKRLAQQLCTVGIHSQPIKRYQGDALPGIGRRLNAWSLLPSGSEGYRTAEVTLGGVDTRELSSTTMESRRVPGLYFVGEVVDVSGWLGGYNFQWAWASAHAAGSAA